MSLYKIEPRPLSAEMQAIREEFEKLNRKVADECQQLLAAGVEPFLEFTYDDNGLPKSVTVRPRRDDDPDSHSLNGRWFNPPQF